MELAAKMDDYGRTAWIAAVVVGFIVFWPLGLAILAYLLWSGRMSFWKCGGPGRWHNQESGGQESRRNGKMWGARRSETSGNSAFDEYREETLRRLEEEQKEFREFLERLRHAKDKAEFDAFMADRRNRGPAPDTGGAEGPAPQPQA